MPSFFMEAPVLSFFSRGKPEPSCRTRLTPDEVYEELDQFRARTQGRITTANWLFPWRDREPGESVSPKFEVTSKGPRLVLHNPHDRFDRLLSFRLEGRKIDCHTNGVVFIFRLVELPTSLVFTVNRQFELVPTKGRLKSAGQSIYVGDSSLQSVKDLLSNRAATSSLKDLKLLSGEYLKQTVAETQCCLVPQGLEADWQRLLLLLRFIDLLPREELPPDKLLFDKSRVPEPLGVLAPLVEQWAISDDAEREMKVCRSSTKRLRALVSAVNPLLSEVDRFLDQQSEPLPDEAILLGDLAQASLEAQIELESRDSDTSPRSKGEQ
jgi:hypothetical protein